MIRTVKKMAAKIVRPEQLWDLQDYLTKSRKEIDSKYDYRYSALPMVFAQLLREGRLKEQDFQGLGKINSNTFVAARNCKFISPGVHAVIKAKRTRRADALFIVEI